MPDQLANQNLLGVHLWSWVTQTRNSLNGSISRFSYINGSCMTKLNEQMTTGVPQMLAFGEGANQQANALNTMQLQTANTSGKLGSLAHN